MTISQLLGAALALATVPGVAAAEDPSGGRPPSSAASSDQAGSAQGSAGAQDGTGGSGDPSSGAAPESNAGSQNVTVIEAEPSNSEARQPFSVTASGGVEGYTSSLAPRINPGPAWGVTLTAMPSTYVGFELSYAGASNSVKDPAIGVADTHIVRNGGDAAVRVNILPTAVAPFIFGGVGFSGASVSNATAGYHDDIFGNIPLGAGVDWQIGAFTAGARFTFNYLFGRDFTPPTRTGAFGFSDKQGGDSYDGVIQVGGVF